MIRILCRLLRPRLALLNGVAALSGYLLFPDRPEPAPVATVLAGVALLAAGGSAFNQLQESGLDLLMERTRLRPLPAGDLTRAAVTGIAVCCTLTGLLLLAAAGGYPPPLFGAAALAWYLAVYTPLKRRTSFALAIGAVCGAIPPLIGWSVAGGDPLDFRVMLLAGILYLWQIPHFWLFQRRHAEDYRRAGIPLVSGSLNAVACKNLFRLWIMALIAASMLLPAFGLIGQPVTVWYGALPLAFTLLAPIIAEKTLFTCLNLVPLLVTLVLLIQKGL